MEFIKHNIPKEITHPYNISYVLVLNISYDSIDDIFHNTQLSEQLPYISLQYENGYMIRQNKYHKKILTEKGSKVPIITFVINGSKIFIVKKSLIITIKSLNTDELKVVDNFKSLVDNIVIDESNILRSQFSISYNINVSNWMPYVFAYIINNNPNLRHVLCYIEINRVITIKSKELLYLKLYDDAYMVVNIRNKNNMLSITITKGK